MALNAVTTADLMREFIVRATNEEAKTHPFISVSLGLRWLSDAYREINRRAKVLIAQHTGDLAAAVVQTDVPEDILDRIVAPLDQALGVLDSAGTPSFPFERDWAYLKSSYFPFTFQGGATGPIDWGWDERGDSPRLVLCPPPAAAVASGLLMDYVKDPGPLARLYDPDESAASASVAGGAAAVDANVDLTGLVETGDAFGVKADDDSLPTRWYRIDSIESLALGQFTLSENYAGTTDATAPFTLAQIPAIESKRPGLCGYAAVEYALARFWETQQGGQNAALEAGALFESEILRIMSVKAARPGIKQPGANAYAHHAALRGR